MYTDTSMYSLFNLASDKYPGKRFDKSCHAMTEFCIPLAYILYCEGYLEYFTILRHIVDSLLIRFANEGRRIPDVHMKGGPVSAI